MKITVPEVSLVLMAGISGSGKSTFARRHFKATEVVSSDQCRGFVADDENDQSATKAAFEVLRCIVSKRLEAGRLAVVDATNVRAEDRAGLIALAKEHDVMTAIIVLMPPLSVCAERNAARPDRAFGVGVLRNQHRALRASLRGLSREGIRYIHIIDDTEKEESATIVRQRLWTDRRHDSGPFDVIGDVHG